MPAHPLYFIALLPPEPIRSEVRALKEEMLGKFGAGHALKSPAHITIQMPFRQPDDKLDALSGALDELAGDTRSFPVELDGFDCFPPRVVFIRIADHAPIIALHEKLVDALRHIGFPDRMFSRNIHPHMTIATRDLEEQRFPNAFETFRQRAYHRIFPADRITLLKHNGRHWTVYREYHMQSNG